ncbi:MAG: beta-1,6-N-acetylglucosaminyltransferase, partial [Acetobacteraceae bacterium]|nr:beta-1,6-N-acetylglucosaminyltransferase [Acetobacteraceae bacterium]
FLPRHLCHWGRFGPVAAAIEGMRWFVRTDADYAILLSGMCFPIRSQAVIRAQLGQLAGRSMMEHFAFPIPQWSGPDRGGYARIERYFVRIPGRKRPVKLPFLKRKALAGFHPFGGSFYWCLSRAAVEQALQTIDEKPWLVVYFKSTYIPDEMFFQTVLMNSPAAPMIDNKLIHYLDWSARGTGPAVIGRDDIPAVAASDALFVRKVQDTAVMQALAESRP